MIFGHHLPAQKLIKSLACIMLAFFVMLTSFPIVAAEPQKTIRIGFPIQTGLTEIDKYGEHSGYTVDALNKIAQYTGWKYEYVTVPGPINQSLTKLLDMLKKGEIDLIGAMTKNASTMAEYEFPHNSYGRAYSTLEVLEDNSSINQSTYNSISPLRVAVLGTAKQRINKLVQFAEISNIDIEIVPCKDREEQREILRINKADVLLNVDISPIDGTRIVDKFAGVPYFMAATKGNTQLISQLDVALQNVQRADPLYFEELYEEHFSISKSQLVMSEGDKSFIAGLGEIKIVLPPSNPPFHYLDENGELCGVTKELLDIIGNRIGTKLQYIVAKDDDVSACADENSATLIAGIAHENNRAIQLGAVLSQPYASVQMTTVINSFVAGKDLNDKVQAIVSPNKFKTAPQPNTIEYDTVEECLTAVNNGDADYTYTNAYAVTYFVSRNRYRNIVQIPNTGVYTQLSLAMKAPVNTRLLSILNRAIRSISEENVRDVIMRSVQPVTHEITLSEYVASNPKFAIYTTITVFLILIAISMMIILWRAKAAKQIKLDNQRYTQIAQIANEFIVQYDYKHDFLTLTNISSEMLGIGRENFGFRKRIANNKYEKDSAGNALLEILNDCQKNSSFTREIKLKLASGEWSWFKVITSTVFNSHNVPLYTVAKLVDIQNEKEKIHALVEKTQKDSWTQIYNAVAFQDLSSKCLQSNKSSGALFVLDIDNFKIINDTFGHLEGNNVLKKLSEKLIEIFQSRDSIVARLGGDEFGVFLINTESIDEVNEIGNIMLKELRQTVGTEDTPVNMTVSIGGSMVKNDDTFETIYRRADEMLYEVKRKGRDGMQIK